MSYKGKKPILYHQESCGICRMLKMALEKKGIEYESIMDTDKMMELGITHTPVLEVDGVRMDAKEALRWVNSR